MLREVYSAQPPISLTLICVNVCAMVRNGSLFRPLSKFANSIVCDQIIHSHSICHTLISHLENHENTHTRVRKMYIRHFRSSLNYEVTRACDDYATKLFPCPLPPNLSVTFTRAGTFHTCQCLWSCVFPFLSLSSITDWCLPGHTSSFDSKNDNSIALIDHSGGASPFQPFLAEFFLPIILITHPLTFKAVVARAKNQEVPIQVPPTDR